MAIKSALLSNLRKLILILQHGSGLLQFATIAFTKRDASIYIIPCAASGKYFYGLHSFNEMSHSDTFELKDQFASIDRPKLSIHQSGHVHIHAKSEKAGPLVIPRLDSLNGHHIATILADKIEGLPSYDRVPCNTASEAFAVIQSRNGERSGRVALFVDGQGAALGPKCQLVVSLTRPTLQAPLRIGVAPIAQVPLAEDNKTGVTVIGGWDPTSALRSKLHFLYLKAE